jgi:soluble lytic murein transglycosylase-like protein
MRLIRKQYPLYFAPLTLVVGVLFASAAYGGAQIYTPLSDSVRTLLQHNISDRAPPNTSFTSQQDEEMWLSTMSSRLGKYIPDASFRIRFLKAVHYEAVRAGLNPQLVLGLIQVESGFRKYAISRSGARGYMQVMPFWVKQIGRNGQDLFHLRTNLRYGCTILRYYLDKENGNLFRALARYNGSLGNSRYPYRVRDAWKRNWTLPPKLMLAEDTAG